MLIILPSQVLRSLQIIGSLQVTIDYYLKFTFFGPGLTGYA